MSDSWYYIGTQDWPVTRDANELSSDQIMEVLDEVSVYYRAAMESLADTAMTAKPSLDLNGRSFGSALGIDQ